MSKGLGILTKKTKAKPKSKKGGDLKSFVQGVQITFRVAWVLLAAAFWVTSRVSVWLWTDVRPLVFAYRRMLWPWVILGVLALIRELVADFTVFQILLYGILTCGVVVFYLRKKLDRGPEWWYAGSALGLALAYVTVYSVADVRLVNIAAVLVWAGFAIIWWSHHPTRFGSRALSSIVEMWNLYVRDLKGSPLSGVEISDPVPFKYGNSYTLQLVRGVHEKKNAENALPKVATALDVPMQNLIVEQHPDFPKTPSKLRLQVVEKSPIEGTVWFDRPRHKDGRILLGNYADGMGEASIRLYTENSMWSGFVVGGMGSGKSRLEDVIAISALDLRNVGQHTVIFYMDGQDGASSSHLFRYADWSVGLDGVVRMLSALERIARHRQLENRVHELEGFTPGSDRPGILVIADEVHAIFKLAPSKFADAMTEWRKIGISFWAADQGSDLARTFASESAIRTGLLTGNGIGMRCTSRSAGTLIPGLETDLYDLPVLPGYGVLVAPPGSDLRTAPFRCRRVLTEKNRSEMATKRESVPQYPTVEDWFERLPSLGLDPGAARAAGPDYTERYERAEAERERLIRLFNGEVLDEGPPSSGGSGSNGSGPHPSGGGPVVSSENASTAMQILALEWSGALEEMTLQEICEELSRVTNSVVNKATVKKALGDLVKAGKLERVAHGVYCKTRVSVTS